MTQTKKKIVHAVAKEKQGAEATMSTTVVAATIRTKTSTPIAAVETTETMARAATPAGATGHADDMTTMTMTTTGATGVIDREIGTGIGTETDAIVANHRKR